MTGWGQCITRSFPAETPVSRQRPVLSVAPPRMDPDTGTIIFILSRDMRRNGASSPGRIRTWPILRIGRSARYLIICRYLTIIVQRVGGRKNLVSCRIGALYLMQECSGPGSPLMPDQFRDRRMIWEMLCPDIIEKQLYIGNHIGCSLSRGKHNGIYSV